MSTAMTRPLPLAPATPLLSTVAAAAAVVAALDLGTCAVYWGLHGIPLERVASGPAAWVVGVSAVKAMGPWAPLLGMLVLYTLAAVEVAGYGWLAGRMPRLLRQPVRFGMLYGAFAFAVLNWLLIPMSAAPGTHAQGNWLVVLLLIYTFVIGVACALCARQLARRA